MRMRRPSSRRTVSSNMPASSRARNSGSCSAGTTACRQRVVVVEDPHRVAPRQPQRLGLHTAGEAPGRGVRTGGVSRQRHGRSRAHLRARALLKPQGSARDQAVHRPGVDAIGHAGGTRPRPDGGQQVTAGRPTELEQVGVRSLWRQKPPELLPRRYDDRLRQRWRRDVRAQSPDGRADERHQRDEVLALGVLAADLQTSPPRSHEQPRAGPRLGDQGCGQSTGGHEATSYLHHPVVRDADVDVGGEPREPVRTDLLCDPPGQHAPLGREQGIEAVRCGPVPGDRGRGQLGLPAVGGERHPRGEPAGPGIAGVEGAQPLGDDRQPGAEVQLGRAGPHAVLVLDSDLDPTRCVPTIGVVGIGVVGHVPHGGHCEATLAIWGEMQMGEKGNVSSEELLAVGSGAVVAGPGRR